MAEINIHLFGKPEWEIDLEKASPDDFKILGEELKERLARISEIIVKLEKNGWERSAGLYDIMYFKKIKLDDAKKEVKELKIDEKEINLDDFNDEEYEDNFEDEDFEEESGENNNFTESKWVKKK